MSRFIVNAIASLRPLGQWSLNGEDPADVAWLDDTIPPTVAEIVAEADRLQAAFTAQQPVVAAKKSRVIDVENIKVTTSSGKTFDGDEPSQDRMTRAITVMNDTDTTLWVMSNNVPVEVTRTELREALRMAGEAQTLLWVKPYTQ